MAKLVTEELWDELEKDIKSSGIQYKIIETKDGKVYVEFLTPLWLVEEGEEDILGRIWKQEWAKNEARAMIYHNPKFEGGQQVCLSLGWTNSLLWRLLKARCQENNIKPQDLAGTRWTIFKKNDTEADFNYIGRVDSKETKKKVEKKSPDIPDNSYDRIKTTVTEIKPELSEDGIEEDKFIKAIAIRANMNDDKVKEHLDNLKKDKLIMTHKGIVLIL